MVITKLTGGVGNQMFQYAAGRILSLNRKTELRLDIGEYAKVKMHNGYELGNFCIKEAFFNKNIFEEIYLKNEKYNRIYKRIVKAKYCYYKEQKYFIYDKNLFEISVPVYLEGYWQSYRYFELYRSQIIKDFEFKNPPSEKNLKLMKQMNELNSIAVHIRRGDYLTNKKFSQIHNVLDLDYYIDAFKMMKSNIQKPNFYIFSDDIEWAKANLKLDENCVYVNNAKGSSIEDLRLMKSCKHNIIANSTFSWWGAWLNIHPDKIVIAPKKWLKTNLEKNSDLIPKEWTRL